MSSGHYRRKRTTLKVYYRAEGLLMPKAQSHWRILSRRRMDSTSFAAKCFYRGGGSAILYPTPISIPLGITASAILSTGDYRTGDYSHRSRIRCTTPTCRSGSLTIWI